MAKDVWLIAAGWAGGLLTMLLYAWYLSEYWNKHKDK